MQFYSVLTETSIIADSVGLNTEALRQSGPVPRIAKILLLDGYSTRTLACVRSWGRKGIAFAVGGETGWDMSLHSRYARQKFVYTSPKRSLSGFIEDVNRYAWKFGADAVFPTSEAGIMACHQHREALACAPIIPHERDMEFVFSKAKTLAGAESAGIAVPRTTRIDSHNLSILDSGDFRFPVAIKSESSEVILGDRARSSEKTTYVSSRAELKADCGARIARGQPVLVQEFVDGYGVGVSGLFSEGRPMVLIAHRRLRESDPCGGPSCLAETIDLDSRIVEPTTALLAQIGFTGPAMIEYKIDRSTSRPYLMEVNGRFWGSILLASAAGLDLPYLYWKMLNGLQVQPGEKRYRVGTRGRYLVGDTKCLLLSLRGKPRNWPGTMATRSAAAMAYLQSFFDPQTVELIFTGSDPAPFFARLVQPHS
ncbi:MAG TPA: ATP-grasp domain-containing protein [Acidobacteriaceae bacterium]|nr:ATP-grasp domain-containing protein [Acidobacteriaceae bacterium]